MGAWPTVLLVDDSRAMAGIMSKLLQQIGVTDLDCVHDGRSALERLHTKRYGLVLSDWEMEPMNGPQLIEAMRRDPALSDIPVILVTAKYDQDQSWLSGGDGYIIKPCTTDSLREKMDEILLHHRNKLTAK